jgi:hypothetical protein
MPKYTPIRTSKHLFAKDKLQRVSPLRSDMPLSVPPDDVLMLAFDFFFEDMKKWVYNYSRLISVYSKPLKISTKFRKAWNNIIGLRVLCKHFASVGMQCIKGHHQSGRMWDRALARKSQFDR